MSLGTPANFNGFRVLASLLHRRPLNGSQPNFARCLAISCAGTLYIHFWGFLPPNGSLLHAKFTLRASLAFSYIPRLLHGTRAVGVSQTAAVNRGRHLYSAGRPPRSASAHILVVAWFAVLLFRRLLPFHCDLRLFRNSLLSLLCRT